MNDQMVSAEAEAAVSAQTAPLEGSVERDEAEGRQAVSAASADGADVDAASDAESEEVFEVEVDEDDIYAYIVDEDDNEIGFIVIDEDGKEQEYYYAEDEASASSAGDVVDDEFVISRETVAETTGDLNAIYKDGIEIASELKEAYDDIMGGFSFLKKR